MVMERLRIAFVCAVALLSVADASHITPRHQRLHRRADTPAKSPAPAPAPPAPALAPAPAPPAKAPAPAPAPPAKGPTGSPPAKGPAGSPPAKGPAGSPPAKGPAGSPPAKGPAGSPPAKGPAGAPAPAAKKDPKVPLVFNLTPADITKLGQQLVADENAIADKIVKAVKPEDATFENVLQVYGDYENNVYQNYAVFEAIAGLGTDQAVQKAIVDADAAFQAATKKTQAREDFKKLVDAVYQKQKDDQKLTEEDRKYLFSVYSAFKTNSYAGVPAGPKRERVQQIDQDLAKLTKDFQAAADADQPILYFTKEELAGMASLAAYKEGTGENKGKLGVPVATEYTNIGTFCTVPETRKKVWNAAENRASGNQKTLTEILALRAERAQLFGYPDYSTYRIENNMAKTPANVQSVLSKTQARLEPKDDKEHAEMLALKKKIEGNADSLEMWDFFFYQSYTYRNIIGTNPSLTREYFPALETAEKILDLYAELFSLKFVEIKGADLDHLSPTGKGADLLWAPDVVLHSVWEADGSEFLGYMYLDLFTRAGKDPGDNQPYLRPISSHSISSDGTVTAPSFVLVMYIPKQTDGGPPALMYRRDVMELLHEAGHGIHTIASKTKFARFSGPLACAADFFEGPSQLMELYSYIPEILKRLSGHYSHLNAQNLKTWQTLHPGEKQPPQIMPDDLVKNITEAQFSFIAGEQLEVLFIGLLDIQYNSAKSPDAARKQDIVQMYNDFYYKVTKYKSSNKRILTYEKEIDEVYAGQVYAYAWSVMYAADVFLTAFKDKPVNGEAGKRWRKTVLEKGNAEDIARNLKTFLGHDPSPDALYKLWGI